MFSRSRLMMVVALTAAISACSKDPEVAKREYLQSGDAYVAQQKYREAVVEYRNAIQQDARFAEARTKLAETYLKLGEPANAYGEFVRAADLLPGDAAAQLRAGEMLLLARKFEDAKSRADQAIAIDPKNTNAQILRANALAGLNDIDAAIQQIDDAIRAAPERSEPYASLGFMRMARGDKAEAEAAFKTAVDNDPKSVNARLALANFYGATSRLKEAEEQMLEAIKLDGKHFMANRAMAYLRLQQGRTAEAEPYLKTIADNAPDDSGKLALADYYSATKRPDDAKAVLQAVAAASNKAHGARLRLANIAMGAENKAEAARLIEEILKIDANHSEALVTKAQLQAADRKLDDSLATLRRAADAAPQAAMVHFALGRLHLLRQDPDLAIPAFQEAVKLNPRLIAAEIELARLHLAAGRPDQALQFADSALQKNPRLADAALIRGRALLAKRDPVEAEKTLKPLAAALPKSATIQIDMARLQLAKKDRAGARKTLDAVLKADPANLEALTDLTRLDIAEGKGAEGRARVDDALQRHPDNPRVLLLAGVTYATLKDYPASEKFIRKALEKDPSNIQAYMTLAQLFRVQKRLPEALAEYKNVADRQPRSVPIQTIYAIMLQMQNRTADAKAVYQRIIEMDPNAAVASNNLAWMITEEGGDLDIALQLAQKAKSQLPDNPEVSDTLGWVYYKKGLATLAVPAFRHSIEKAPANPLYHYHLGLAYVSTGDQRAAREALEQALKLNANFEGAADARKALAALSS